MKKAFFIVVGVIVAGLASYTMFASDSVSHAEDSQMKSVKTIGLSPALFQETAEFSGFVRGVRQTDIAPKISGSLVKLSKEEGETVRQGEVLAVLDGNELSAMTKSSLLSLQSISKTFKETEKYYNQKVDEAKTALDNTSGSAATDAAKEAVKSAKRLRDAELASLQTQKASVEGSVLVSQTNASNTIIRAPFTGVITRKNASLGSFVSPGMSIYSLASPDAFEVAVSLPSTIGTKITKGSTVSVADGTTTVEGYVFSVASMAEEASQQSVAHIRFSSASVLKIFHLGQHVQISFPVGTTRTALLIPEKAIVSEYDDTFVYTVENGQSKKHAVVLGVAAGNNREILSGLSDGMHVVVEGEYALSDNQPVEEIYATQ